MMSCLQFRRVISGLPGNYVTLHFQLGDSPILWVLKGFPIHVHLKLVSSSKKLHYWSLSAVQLGVVKNKDDVADFTRRLLNSVARYSVPLVVSGCRTKGSIDHWASLDRLCHVRLLLLSSCMI